MITYIIIGVVAVLVVFLCFGLAIASFSGENYFEMLEQTRNTRNSYGITTYDFVNEINEKHFDGKLRLAKTTENNDHYVGGQRVVALSEETMSSNSLASIATIAHELGHARQDATGKKLDKHFVRRKKGRFVGLFFMPSALAGVVLGVLYFLGILESTLYLYLGFGFVGIAILIFLFAVYLKFMEVQVEKEASTFALDYLREYLTEPEVKVCKEFLDSARLTYWALLFKTLLGWTFLTKKDKMFR